MSNANLARRTKAEVAFDGVNITNSIRPYLLSISYTDNEEDTSDGIQIKLQDKDDLWLQGWLDDAIECAAAEQLAMDVVFVRENWNSDGGDVVLSCGEFELDSVQCAGPPNTISIKGTALPFSSKIRQTKKNKAWEAYYLSGIAKEMAAASGLTCMYESDNDPYYERVEQINMSDIAFLSKLCHDAGISLKTTSKIVVMFDQQKYERTAPVRTFARRDRSYISYNLDSGSAGTQYASCRVSYVNPQTGQCIEATVTAEDLSGSKKGKSDQQLEVSAKVETVEEARKLAAKKLREVNKFGRQVSFTVPGDPALVAGVTVMLSGWGGWSGKYIIKSAVHKLDGSGGYTTQVSLRRVLEGY